MLCYLLFLGVVGQLSFPGVKVASGPQLRPTVSSLAPVNLLSQDGAYLWTAYPTLRAYRLSSGTTLRSEATYKLTTGRVVTDSQIGQILRKQPGLKHERTYVYPLWALMADRMVAGVEGVDTCTAVRIDFAVRGPSPNVEVSLKAPGHCLPVSYAGNQSRGVLTVASQRNTNNSIRLYTYRVDWTNRTAQKLAAPTAASVKVNPREPGQPILADLQLAASKRYCATSMMKPLGGVPSGLAEANLLESSPVWRKLPPLPPGYKASGYAYISDDLFVGGTTRGARMLFRYRRDTRDWQSAGHGCILGTGGSPPLLVTQDESGSTVTYQVDK